MNICYGISDDALHTFEAVRDKHYFAKVSKKLRFKMVNTINAGTEIESIYTSIDWSLYNLVVNNED